MIIDVPEFSLVVLIGASGSGKSTFALKHFQPDEVISSDRCRGIVSNDPNDQSATSDAFDLLRFILTKRLSRRLLTVVDATNVQKDARKSLIEIAKAYHALPVCIVLNLSANTCHKRNQARSDRQFGPHVVRRHVSQLKRSLRGLKREGFRRISILESEDDIAAATVNRVPLWNNKRDQHGPFDIVGDVHGCRQELEQLLAKLGYVAQPIVASEKHEAIDTYVHPEGRRIVFVGDLVDRGPDSPGVLRIVMAMVKAGSAYCVPGNHDAKLLRKLNGKNVRPTHGLAETLEQLECEDETFIEQIREFLSGLISHYIFDDGKLVIAHAGMKESLQGRASGRVREFALYGETTGETDEYGLPVRYDWAEDYRGKAAVVYGHTPVADAEWINNTMCIDTGCVFGGQLTALRYPERELASVQADQTYCEPIKPLTSRTSSGEDENRSGTMLDIRDVSGRRVVRNRFHHSVTIREEHADAALETMSRFSIDPRWLIYLPPTMSPAKASTAADMLERPEPCFEYFRGCDISSVICEEKHMGSRAVIVVCRDETVARDRFLHDRSTSANERIGVIYTRGGRSFFSDPDSEAAILREVVDTLTACDFWATLDTDWACLDCEILPWSAKAKTLLEQQYGPVGAAATASLSDAESLLMAKIRQEEAGLGRGPSDNELSTIDTHPSLASSLLDTIRDRQHQIAAYRQAYRQYCWEVDSISDYKIAPFHIMATEGQVHIDKEHGWHMGWADTFAKHQPDLFRATAHRVVDLGDSESESAVTAWWETLTSAGGEGMVVKPLAWINKASSGSSKERLVQPALKCRGPEYLRIIYGPEYRSPAHLDRLRNRNLSAKRRLARKAFVLGLEALSRFVDREPLYRVHECVFGILALDAEPVDPRL